MVTAQQAAANKGKALYVSTPSGVNIRKGPGTTYDIVEKLPNGAYAGKLKSYSQQADGIWYVMEAEKGKAERWVRNDLVTIKDATTSQASTGSGKGMTAIQVEGIKNRLVIATPTSGVNLRSGAGTNFSVITAIPKGQVAGKVIGYQLGADGYNWLVLRPVPEQSAAANRFVRSDLVEPSDKPKPKSDTQTDASQDGAALVDALIDSDYQLYHNLLFIGENIDRLKKQGIDVAKESATYTKLIAQWAKRRQKIESNKYIKDVQTGFDNAYSWIKAKWDNMVSAVVTLSVGAIVAIAFVGGVAASALLYAMFKPDYSTSKANLKESEDLKKALAKVDADTAEKIRVQIEGQIDDAYNAGAGNATFDSIITAGKWGLGIFIGFKLTELIRK